MSVFSTKHVSELLGGEDEVCGGYFSVLLMKKMDAFGACS